MLICAQAFQTTPARHAPAIALAFAPHLAGWGKTLIDGALGAAGTNAAAVGLDKMAGNGVLYHGLQVLGGGSILAGLILGATGVFVIDRRFKEAAAFALAGAVLTYFGFMHGEAIGIGNGLGVTPAVTFAYLIVAALFYGCAKYSAAETAPEFEHLSDHGVLAQPAE
jgi:AGZA family xanthine/uracil permease-like MFS transporter